MQDRETRVRRYAELRDQIDRMDTLSFDDPNREERYGLNGKKELTGHKYLDSESEEKIDHYDYSYEDSKEEKTGNYISHHNYKYFILKAWNWDNNYYNEYEYKRYKRRVIVLDTGKKIYGDWWFDEKYYK